MAAAVSFASANITRDDGETWEGVQAIVRGNRLTIAAGGATLHVNEGIQTAVRAGRTGWTLTDAGGQVYTVERLRRPCGCAGGRT